MPHLREQRTRAVMRVVTQPAAQEMSTPARAARSTGTPDDVIEQEREAPRFTRGASKGGMGGHFGPP